MNEVKNIFWESGGSINIYIRIGNINLLIPRWKYEHLEDGSVLIHLTDLGIKLYVNVGDKYHDNKLEVLKSEFEYTKR